MKRTAIKFEGKIRQCAEVESIPTLQKYGDGLIKQTSFQSLSIITILYTDAYDMFTWQLTSLYIKWLQIYSFHIHELYMVKKHMTNSEKPDFYLTTTES